MSSLSLCESSTSRSFLGKCAGLVCCKTGGGAGCFRLWVELFVGGVGLAKEVGGVGVYSSVEAAHTVAGKGFLEDKVFSLLFRVSST